MTIQQIQGLSNTKEVLRLSYEYHGFFFAYYLVIVLFHTLEKSGLFCSRQKYPVFWHFLLLLYSWNTFLIFQCCRHSTIFSLSIWLIRKWDSYFNSTCFRNTRKRWQVQKSEEKRAFQKTSQKSKQANRWFWLFVCNREEEEYNE